MGGRGREGVWAGGGGKGCGRAGEGRSVGGRGRGKGCGRAGEGRSVGGQGRGKGCGRAGEGRSVEGKEGEMKDVKRRGGKGAH